jgi:RNA polymerase sporulation-specific sigma factor
LRGARLGRIIAGRQQRPADGREWSVGVNGRVTRASELEAATDEELVASFRDGEQLAVEALLNRYRGFTRLEARSYFLAGADQVDIVQEGMIGLYKAIRDFDPGRETSFRSFAEVCVTARSSPRSRPPPGRSTSRSTPTSLVEGARRRGRAGLGPAGRDPGPEISDPAELVISGDEMRNMKIAFAEILSDFEAEVLHMYVEGKSYPEIAGHLDRT